MCVKFPPRDLNPDSCPPHPTITYTTYFIAVTKNKKNTNLGNEQCNPKYREHYC